MGDKQFEKTACVANQNQIDLNLNGSTSKVRGLRVREKRWRGRGGAVRERGRARQGGKVRKPISSRGKRLLLLLCDYLRSNCG